MTVTWAVSDPESAITTQTGCDATTITEDAASITLTCEATSGGGTASKSVTLKYDATRPTLSPSVPTPVLLNSDIHAAEPNAVDAVSGVMGSSCGNLETSSVGNKTVSCGAIDRAGNTISGVMLHYRVEYAFPGFSAPINNDGVVNKAKAGQMIPLTWRLTDAEGNPVTGLAAVTVTVTNTSCTAGTSADDVEEYSAGTSGLQNLGDGYYQYNWKTEKSYANSCKTMHLDLGEGITRTALIQFTK